MIPLANGKLSLLKSRSLILLSSHGIMASINHTKNRKKEDEPEDDPLVSSILDAVSLGDEDKKKVTAAATRIVAVRRDKDFTTKVEDEFEELYKLSSKIKPFSGSIS